MATASIGDAARALVAVGARMDRLGWVPGSSGNLSARLNDATIAITRSGVHKGRLSDADIIAVGLDGAPRREGDKPSAETLLHCQLYARFAEVGAVLHGHSLAATVLSMAVPGDALVLEGYEILKAFPGILTHRTRVSVPIFDNDQDMARLAGVIGPVLDAAPLDAAPLDAAPIGYMLRGHGVYAWGPDVERGFWRLEALEFLLACELERRRIR